MGFLRRLFGGEKKSAQGDTRGLYFYVRCNYCGARVRLRADKEYDLNRTDDGFVWHKTIVDSKCFRQIPAVVHLDRNYEVVSAEIEGGEFISREAYEAPEAAQEVEPDVEPDSEEGEQEPLDPDPI